MHLPPTSPPRVTRRGLPQSRPARQRGAARIREMRRRSTPTGWRRGQPGQGHPRSRRNQVPVAQPARPRLPPPGDHRRGRAAGSSAARTQQEPSGQRPSPLPARSLVPPVARLLEETLAVTTPHTWAGHPTSLLLGGLRLPDDGSPRPQNSCHRDDRVRDRSAAPTSPAELPSVAVRISAGIRCPRTARDLR